MKKLKIAIISFSITIILVVVVGIVGLILFVNGAFDGILAKKMLEYYRDDNNYVELEGVIVSKDNKADVLYIEITTENHDFSTFNDKSTDFRIYSETDVELNIGDTLKFISAPMYFYNGHRLPIISLEKDGEIYLTFEKGKSDYLNWIQKTFGD